MQDATKNITVEDAFAIAKEQFLNNNFLATINSLNEILKIVPQYTEAWHMLGLAYYNSGDVIKAVDSLKEAIKYDNKNAILQCNLGSFLAEATFYDEALKAFDKAILLDSNYPDSYWNKANLLCLLGKYQKAREYAGIATNLAPDRKEAWLNLGMVEIKLGNIELACNAWERSLEIDSNYMLALNNLGNVFREIGKLDEAKAKILKALEIDSTNAKSMNNLGNILFDLGEFQEAENWYKKAVSQDPEYAEVHNNLAVCLIQQQKFADAVIEAKYASIFDKDYAEAYMNLAIAEKSMGNILKAEKALQQAIILDDKNILIKIEQIDLMLMLGRFIDAEMLLQDLNKLEITKPQEYMKLAVVLEKMGKITEAIDKINQAIGLSDKIPEIYIRKGQICHMHGYVDLAEDAFKKALRLSPKNPAIFISLADLYQTKGDMQVAKNMINKAKDINGNLPAIYSVISKLKKFTEPDDADLKIMLELAKTVENRGNEAAASLYFALFSAFDNLGEYNKAFQYLEKANNCKRKTIADNLILPKDKVLAQVKQEYTKNSFLKLKDAGYKSKLAVFILGMPRSGTTLLEQILSSHPKIYGAGELLDFGIAEAKYKPLNKENCYKIGKSYIENIKKYNSKNEASKIINKMPGNFMRIGQVISTLPQAKIIHCKRNPLDTCFSCYKQNFAKGHEWSYNLQEIKQQYELYLEVMEYWRQILPENSFIEVNYEDLVNNLEVEAKRILEYLELSWHEACLLPHLNKRDILTASKNQVREPIYNTSINSWEKYEEYLPEDFKSLVFTN